MERILIIIFFLPICVFAQLDQDYLEEVNNTLYLDENPKKYIVKIKPTSLFLRDLAFSCETEISDRQTITVGIPLYLKRDISKMTTIRLLAPLVWNIDKDDADDILDEAKGIAYLSGYGLIFKYKKYLNESAQSMTGFYISPEYYFRRLNIDIDASYGDLLDIASEDGSPFPNPHNGDYELEGHVKINTISINGGHQWIRDWFTVDLYIGLGHYSIRYEFEEEGVDDDLDDTEQQWLPRFGLNLGVAF